MRIFIVHINGMFWVKFRMFLIIRVYGSFSANTLWIIPIFRFYGNFGVSKFILRFYRRCGRNDIVRFSRRTATQARETTLKIQESLSPKVVTNIAKRYISFTKESIKKKTIYSKKNTPTRSWQLTSARPSSMASRLVRARNVSQRRDKSNKDFTATFSTRSSKLHSTKTQFHPVDSANCSVER